MLNCLETTVLECTVLFCLLRIFGHVPLPPWIAVAKVMAPLKTWAGLILENSFSLAIYQSFCCWLFPTALRGPMPHRNDMKPQRGCKKPTFSAWKTRRPHQQPTSTDTTFPLTMPNQLWLEESLQLSLCWTMMGPEFAFAFACVDPEMRRDS